MEPERLDDVDDLQKKKDLLQTEIINKNLNKEQFIDYCSSKKTYGDDLARWEYSELRSVVSEFVRFHEEEEKKNRERQLLIMQSQRKNEEIRIDISQLKQEKVQYQSGAYTKEIPCKKLEMTVLNYKQINVTVRNPKGIETGMFKTNYITYEVFTDATNWIVRRRYSDFEWLRLTLAKFFPRLAIPPLPSKKIGGRRFEADFVEKRMTFLQMFISNVVKNETLKASDCLFAFLSMNDRSQFECKMRELTSFVPSPFVEDVKTLTGKLKVLEDDGNEEYYKTISNYFKLQSQLFDRLNYNFKNFYYNINAACMNLEEAKTDFETLHLLNQRLGIKEPIVSAYNDLTIFFKNWKRILYNENEVIKSHIKDFFKYMKMEGTTYEELIRSRDDLRNKYMVEHAKLSTKKDKLWATMDVGKWEIIDEMDRVDRLLLVRDKSYATAKMCTRETQIVENLHKQLDYANSVNHDELTKMINDQCITIKENLRKFIESFYPSLNDGLNVWSELASSNDKENHSSQYGQLV